MNVSSYQDLYKNAAMGHQLCLTGPKGGTGWEEDATMIYDLQLMRNATRQFSTVSD